MDTDVKLSARHIRRPEALPIENLVTRIRMQDSVLTLDPLDFGVAGGHLAGTISLNGREEPIQAHAKMRAQHLALNQMFPKLKLSKTSIGQLNGEFDLAGKGNAVAAMLGTSNGNMTLIVGPGKISKLMMEMINLHLLEILQLKLSGDEIININCGLADFNVKRGAMDTNLLLLDTSITSIFGSGKVDLASENLDIVINQKPKKTSPVSLRTPIYVRGTLGSPDVSLDKKQIATRGLGAIALGALSPILALIPLVDPETGFENECGKLLHGARARAIGVAPTPATPR